MPTSDFCWPVHHTPVFQVFGTKRKNSLSEDYVSVTESQEQKAKRQCTTQDNGNHIHPSSIQSHTTTHHPISQPTWNQDLNVEMQTDSSQEQMTGQSEPQALPDSRVMDLSTEHVTPQAEQDFEDACNSMDSDFVPDTQQYSYSSNCNSYCGNENGSPRSRVRCFCKPSWEGVLDMRPYVSDIY